MEKERYDKNKADQICKECSTDNCKIKDINYYCAICRDALASVFNAENIVQVKTKKSLRKN